MGVSSKYVRCRGRDPPVAEQDESVFGGILKETKQRLGAAKKSLWKFFLKNSYKWRNRRHFSWGVPKGV